MRPATSLPSPSSLRCRSSPKFKLRQPPERQSLRREASRASDLKLGSVGEEDFELPRRPRKMPTAPRKGCVVDDVNHKGGNPPQPSKVDPSTVSLPSKRSAARKAGWQPLISQFAAIRSYFGLLISLTHLPVNNGLQFSFASSPSRLVVSRRR